MSALSFRSQAVEISDLSRIGESRRLATSLAQMLHFEDGQIGKLAIIINEAGSNIIKHAGHGLIIFRPLFSNEDTGIEMLALDFGPGMDVEKCLKDGFSTVGTAGQGLGAILRQSNYFEVYSRPKVGTVLLSQVHAKSGPRKSSPVPFIAGGVCLPVENEKDCGDNWALTTSRQKCTLLVADGLGHGTLAAEASDLAVECFHQNSHLRPLDILERTHARLKPTRGAAIFLVEIAVERGLVTVGAIGNVAGTIIERGVYRNLVSLNGTAGHHARRLQEFTYPIQPGALLILYTDGLTSRWKLENYPGLIGYHPSIVSAILFRDFKRERDDVTVVAVRFEEVGNPGL